jgi:hypothetical protein
VPVKIGLHAKTEADDPVPLKLSRSKLYLSSKHPELRLTSLEALKLSILSPQIRFLSELGVLFLIIEVTFIEGRGKAGEFSCTFYDLDCMLSLEGRVLFSGT